MLQTFCIRTNPGSIYVGDIIVLNDSPDMPFRTCQWPFETWVKIKGSWNKRWIYGYQIWWDKTYANTVIQFQEAYDWSWKRINSLRTFNSLSLRQNVRHFADDTFKLPLFYGNRYILLKMSLKFVPRVAIKIMPVLDRIVAIHHTPMPILKCDWVTHHWIWGMD